MQAKEQRFEGIAAAVRGWKEKAFRRNDWGDERGSASGNRYARFSGAFAYYQHQQSYNVIPGDEQTGIKPFVPA